MKTTTMWALLAVAGLAACDESDDTDPLGSAGGGDASIDPDGGAGGTAITHDAYYAVLSDNYSGAVVVSLLGEEGDVVEDGWLTPRIDDPDLRTPFTDDAVLPTVSASRRYLDVIERGLGVVTRFDLEADAVVGQMKTDASPEDDAAAFHSNPNDVVVFADDLGWVSRWAKNLDPTADDAELGNDLIAYDASTMTRGEMRIDLGSLDTMVTETQYDQDFNPIGEIESTAWARPSRLAPAGEHLVVGLVRLTDAYTPAEGAIAVVDPTSGEITDSLVLAGLKNCGDVYPVAGEPNRVLVGCIGDWNTVLGPETGIVMIEVDADGTASIVESRRVADHPGAAAAGQYLVSLGGTRVLALASGTSDFDTGDVIVPDRVYVVDLARPIETMVLESKGAFAIGTPSYDPESGLVLLPDAGSFEEPLVGVWRLRVSAGGVTVEDFVEVAPDEGLAARQVLKL